MNGMDGKRILHSLCYLACVVHCFQIVTSRGMGRNTVDQAIDNADDQSETFIDIADNGVLRVYPYQNENTAIKKSTEAQLPHDDVSSSYDEKNFEKTMQMHPGSFEDKIKQSSTNANEIYIRDDVIGMIENKNNERLMKKLQKLPTDKLKNLLTFIDEHKQINPMKLRGDNAGENQPINTEGLNLHSQNANARGMKLTFHRLSPNAMHGDVTNNGNQDIGVSKGKLHMMKMVNGRPRTVETVEPATSVLIHAFEGGKDEENNDYQNSNLRAMSREENEVQQPIRPFDKMSEEDESMVKNEDLFAGIEEKTADVAHMINQSAPASNIMSFSHPFTHRNFQHKEDNMSSIINKDDVSKNENLSHEEMSSKNINTLVNQINSKPIVDRVEHNTENHHEKVEEKLPNTILQEINNAMIENVRNSGDMKVSLPDSKPRYDLQETDSRDQKGFHSKLATETMENLQSNTNKRASKSQYAFSYDPESPIGPEMWKVLHTDWTCQGRKQSPINIVTENVINDTVSNNVIIRVEPEGRPTSGILRNNGHAPTFSLTNGAIVRLIGGRLPNDYYLKQLHLHFGCEGSRGSEHKIDGQSYPLELHLVFWDKKTFATFAQAAKSDRGLAVVAVLFQRSFVPSGQVKNTPLSQMIQVVRKVPNEGDFVQITDIFDFRLEKLIPNIMNAQQADRFFTYEGSLSTPGCYESVSWFVYDTHPSVTDDQLEILRKLKSTKVNSEGTMCDNFRPIQKSYGRRIYSNII